MRRLVSLLAAATALALPAPTSAQTAGPATVAPRGYLSINGGYQATANTFSNTWKFDYNADSASTTASYPVKASFLFDAGAGARVWRRLLVGAAVSRLSRSGTVSMTGSIPHPFFFEMRPVEGSDSGVRRSETAVHMQATWVLGNGGRIQAAVFGGPSVFRVEQALVTKANFNEAYPYDTVTLSSLTTEVQAKSAIGFNLGADITYLVSRRVGVGVLIRLSRASLDFESPDKNAVETTAGGAQIGAGLRLRF